MTHFCRKQVIHMQINTSFPIEPWLNMVPSHWIINIGPMGHDQTG